MTASIWLQRPPLPDFDASKIELTGLLTPPSGLPVWAFLQHLVNQRKVLLHGSAAAGIERFEPRTPFDLGADTFSKQTAVFAASDAIWAMSYALLDRSKKPRFLNTAMKRGDSMQYFFSLSVPGAWAPGTVYLLPAEGFVQMPAYTFQGEPITEPHWASLEPVQPLARLQTVPADFPFLNQTRTHDPARIDRLALSDPDGFPWIPLDDS